jgi:hypothetical protein
MKRIIGLLVALGLASSLLIAQQPTFLLHDGHTSGMNIEKDYTVQTGHITLLSQGQVMPVELGYTLFPQPTTRALTLVLNSNRLVRPTVYLTDTEGNRLPYQADAVRPDARQRLVLNLKKLPAGMYYLVIAVPGMGQSEGMPIIKLDAQPVLMQ